MLIKGGIEMISDSIEENLKMKSTEELLEIYQDSLKLGRYVFLKKPCLYELLARKEKMRNQNIFHKFLQELSKKDHSLFETFVIHLYGKEGDSPIQPVAFKEANERFLQSLRINQR